MSFQATNWAVSLPPSVVSGTDRMVLFVLANHAGHSEVNDAWECYPGVKRIAAEAGLTRVRTAQEALSRLEAAGLIERFVNGAPDSRLRGDRRPNLYRLPVDSYPSNGVTPNDIPSDERGDVPAHNGVSDGDITGCRFTAPKQSLEQSVEKPSATDKPSRAAKWTDQVRSVATEVYDQRKARGQVQGRNAFAAYCSVASNFEGSGVARCRLIEAMVESPTVTINTVQFQLNRQPSPTRSGDLDQYDAPWMNNSARFDHATGQFVES